MKVAVILVCLSFLLVSCESGTRDASAVEPTPRRLSDTSSAMNTTKSLSEKQTIDLRRDGNTYKDKETGDKYKVTEGGRTLTIENLQTGEKVDYNISGQNLTNKKTGQKFKMRRDGSNIKLTRND